MTGGIKKTYCSSPLRSNAHYQAMAASCGPDQMLCQPALFGLNNCIDTKTQSQKNSAFSQCQQNFLKSGLSLDDLADQLKSDKIGPLGDEMFALVHDICENDPFQSNTVMCSKLKKKVSEIKEIKPSTKMPETKAVEVVSGGKIVEDEELKNRLIKTLDQVNAAPTVATEINQKVHCDQCEQIKRTQMLDEVLQPYEASEPIDQSKVTPKDYCAGNQKGSPRQKYSQGGIGDDSDVSVNVTYQQNGDDKKNRVVSGYSINSDKLGQSYSYIEDGIESSSDEMAPMYPARDYAMDFEGRGKDGSFSIVDSPIKEVYQNKKLKERYLSTNLRITEYSFFPRNNVPSIKKRDDKLIMKLTTGEDIVVNSKTGRIISGVAQEAAPKNQIENRPNDKRIYPDSDFSYQGEGLYIESRILPNKDEKKPGSLVSVKAIVEGKKQECKLKSEDIWQYDYGSYLPKEDKDYLSSEWSCTRFKFEKDEDLYTLIKKTCPSFRFPKLVK